jgi:cytochrome c oxidase accessory protein FixG
VSLRVVAPENEKRGDCVDCGLCVATCPTGIDIRNGLQMECVSCTQCIDACDAVMTKLGRARGLIRYSSQAIVGGQKRHVLRPRVVIYPLVLLVIVAAFLIVLSTKGPADVTVLRGIGRPFVDLPEDQIGNPVKIKIVNRTDLPELYAIGLSGADALHLTIEENPIRVAPGQSKALPAMIAAPKSIFQDGEAVVHVTIKGEKFETDVRYRMMGPASRHHTGPTGGT